MTQFVVVYDRLTGQSSIVAFDGRDAARLAVEERIRAEAVAGPDQEVTTLNARSEADLRATHARYFQGAAEMLEDLQKLAAS